MLLIVAITSSLSSCKKDEDEGKLPNIAFNTGTGYTHTDATVAKDSSLKIGIIASKAESNDVLTKFTVVQTIGTTSTTDSTVYTENLSGSNGDNYNHDYTFKAPSAATKEKLTFTVVNRDGLTNSVSLTLTVQ